MLLAIYKYKIDAFLNKSIPPLNNPILCYRTYDSYLKENKILFFKNKWEGEYIQVGSWDYFFDGYVPDEYWNFIPSELKEYKEIPGFSHIDYLGINLLINKMFCVFDINKHYYR
ncbi:hypothetical protein LWT85_24395, partial [Enterobacter hormaechei]|nr:hypothetical protein [Enterobacter hormaechei]